MSRYQVTIVCACGACGGDGEMLRVNGTGACPKCVTVPAHFRKTERFYDVRATSEQGAKNAATAAAKTERLHVVGVTRVRLLEEPEPAPQPSQYTSARRRRI